MAKDFRIYDASYEELEKLKEPFGVSTIPDVIVRCIRLGILAASVATRDFMDNNGDITVLKNNGTPVKVRLKL